MIKLSGEIILIDDEEYELELLNEVLAKLSYDVTVRYFNNARDAVGYLRATKSHIFLIISDLQMYPMSGLELKAAIEKESELKMKAIPFVFATTYATEENIELAYQHNIQGFFEKPNTPNKQVDFLSIIIRYWIINLHPNNGKQNLEMDM